MKPFRKVSSGIFAKGEERVKSKGVGVESSLKEGHVVHEIVKVAEEGGFNLIVLGARGISRIKEMLLGSVSDEVLKNVRCPVLIAKQSLNNPLNNV